MTAPAQVWACRQCFPAPATPECRRSGHTLVLPGDPTAPDGAVLTAVRADLDGIDIAKVPGGHTYKALALWLAGVIDKRGSDDGPSVTAKLAERLTAVMQALTKKGGEDDNGFQSFEEDVSTPSVGG